MRLNTNIFYFNINYEFRVKYFNFTKVIKMFSSLILLNNKQCIYMRGWEIKAGNFRSIQFLCFFFASNQKWKSSHNFMISSLRGLLVFDNLSKSNSFQFISVSLNTSWKIQFCNEKMFSFELKSISSCWDINNYSYLCVKKIMQHQCQFLHFSHNFFILFYYYELFKVQLSSNKNLSPWMKL